MGLGEIAPSLPMTHQRAGLMRRSTIIAALLAASFAAAQMPAVGAKHSVELLGLPVNITFTHSVPGLLELGYAACIAACAAAYRAVFGDRTK